MAASSSWREPVPTLTLKEERCRACRRKLGEFDGRGRAEIVCPKCRTLNTIPRK